jgi:uncharacterized protein YjbI with pentapeptide repeats
MVLHRVDLSEVTFGRFLAHGTVFAECIFSSSSLKGAEVLRWEGQMAIEQDPLEHFPSLSSDSTWDHSHFELEDGDEETYGGLVAQRWTKSGQIWGCDMRGAVLTQANLTGLSIEESNLSGANLRQAKLAYGKLENVSLSGADLSGADLYSADFVRVDLSGANLTGAIMTGLSIEDVILDGVIGYKP